MNKPSLYIHVGRATHFLEWELPEFKKYFTLVNHPNKNVPLLSFGPDVLKEASTLPASKRFATMFPGFGHNPLYNNDIRNLHLELLANFDKVFINPGPLEIAYKRLKNVEFYPFSVDTKQLLSGKLRDKLDSLIHISNDGPQKDWMRSTLIMKKTGLAYEVYPPRNSEVYDRQVRKNEVKNRFRRLLLLKEKKYLPHGYLDHRLIIKKYQSYDGFVHVAKDIKHPKVIDGKYTACLIEAGVTGAILFWHDTFNLGNNLETVFNLPLNEDEAAQNILNIRSYLDIQRHSKLTREEMLDTFRAEKSVQIRAQIILNSLVL